MSNRLFSNILTAWQGVSTQFSGKRLDLSDYLHTNELEPLRVKVRQCLECKGGEVSTRSRAAELGTAYLGLNDEGRQKFLKLLITDFGVDHDKVRTTAEELFTDLSADRRSEVEEQLREYLTPPYRTLLRQFNALPQGIKFLVDLRSDAMRLSKDHPELKPVDETLQTQLRSWFDIGFLELRKIDWNTSAAVLEKLIQYEAVHRVKSWIDLHHRLGDNRRCFAFFHPSMPNEPLIFVWVALVDEISNNVNTLLDSDTPEVKINQPTTAVFYSITSAQRGLAGVSLGHFLIKRVVDELMRQCPSLTTFSTLSPVPGFVSWMQQAVAEPDQQLLTEEETEALRQTTDKSFEELLHDTAWLTDDCICNAMREPLQRSLANYIVNEKKPSGKVANAIANFHLSNGAIFERINWLGDTSEGGLSRSYGMMINYLYDLDFIDKNHEEYIEYGRIAQSKQIQKYLKI